MFEEFFRNPGTKIKKIPKILLLIYIIVEGLLAVVILFSNHEMFLLTLLMIAVGFVAVLVSCLYMYAYGEVVESISDNAQVNAEILRILKKHYGGPNNESLSGQTSQIPPGGWRCVCGRIHYPYVTSCACGKNKWDVVKND